MGVTGKEHTINAMNRFQPTLRCLLVALAAPFFLVASAACDRDGDGDGAGPQAAMTHDGQGEELSADPTFQIKVKFGGADPEYAAAARIFAVYEAKPAKGDAKQDPQGFELRGEKIVIAGLLPAELKFAPKHSFADLVGQQLSVRRVGGDPTATDMSKITTSDDKVFAVRGGTLTVEKAFFRRGQYAGVSGTFDLDVQQIKLGDPDDPNNPTDTPIGEPVKAAGTFTVRAESFAFESL